MDKRVVRKEVREALAAISPEEKTQKSTMLALALLVHPAVRNARVVALFSPLPDEPQIGEIIELLSHGRIVLLPRVEGDVMRFYTFSPEAMYKGSYGILEPMCGNPFPPAEIDVIIVPGVAFTADGARMGRGKGFYDKYMSQEGFNAHKIGVCYSEQVVQSLPCERHDVFMDEVVYK